MNSSVIRRNFMAALSDYLESGLLNHVFRGNTFPIPETVAATATPLETDISAVAPLPLPVIVSSTTPPKVYPPDIGVYPIPALIILNTPVAVPATPAKLPLALVPN